ncbi:isoprenyl transferase [Parabacteroides sp. FAFU027]|uniref:isoprenyl transferase n=1 Tax=Parabacteroides sp. FAFU027 TaxID=2922715 RepID=UPI001FAF143B|nr:isoprenyl transferase [Parabacteroides sp. FAFU027]
MTLKTQIDPQKLPRHIAIIMDGNGRWAKLHGKPRSYGHQYGVESVRKVIEAAVDLKIEYLTLYTFSSENWNRPDEEVQALMGLLVHAIEHEKANLNKNNIRMKVIGDTERLFPEVREKLFNCIDDLSQNTGLTLVLALSYSSRWEILNAAQKIATLAKEEKLDPSEIDESLFSQMLTTKEIPDPDLMIRTGGEIRISNFLLWQAAYTELYFTDEFWPDFNAESLYKAICFYQTRERRFGKTSEQVK